MAWTIILEDEKKQAVRSLQKEFVSKEMFNSEFLKQTTLLKYIDPYGDTVFNNLQIDDLVKDLVLLKGKEDNNMIDEIVLLAEECKSEIHTYLTFYGD